MDWLARNPLLFVGAAWILIGASAFRYAKQVVEARSRMPAWLLNDPPYPIAVAWTKVVGGIIIAMGVSVILIGLRK